MPVSRILLFSLLACTTIATSGWAQNSGKYIKRLEQPDKTLYFATPVAFKAKNPKLVFEPDFTLNYGPQETGEVVLHFSIYCKEPIKAVDSIAFSSRSTGELVVSCSPAEQMYLDRSKKKWHSRFTTTLSKDAYLQLLLLGDRFQAELFYPEGKSNLIRANKAWRKSSEVVYQILANELR